MLTEKPARDASGITQAHIDAFLNVAWRKDMFILFRPVNPLSTNLIASGYGTKPGDLKAKSSDWGPHAGFIPHDQNISKRLGNPTMPLFFKPPEKYKPVPIVLTFPRLHELVKKQCINHTPLNDEEKLVGFQSNFNKPIPGYFFRIQKAFNVQRGMDHISFLELRETAKKLDIDWRDCFTVQYGYCDQTTYIHHKILKVFSLKHLPLTADYDLFAICPRLSIFHKQSPKAHDELFSPRKSWEEAIESIKAGLDSKSRIRLESNDRMPFYVRETINDLNMAAHSSGGKVVHHGTEMDRESGMEEENITILTPRREVFVTQTWQELEKFTGEIDSLGYLFYQNRRYRSPHPSLRTVQESASPRFASAAASVHSMPDSSPGFTKQWPGEKLEYLTWDY